MKRSLFASLFLCLLILTACSPQPAWKTISPEEAKALMDTKTDYLLLDVRTQEEFDAEHIPGALLLPDTEVEAQAKSLLPNKKQLILVYCRSGRRSAASAEVLAKLGYTNVEDFGGIIDWPYEVEGANAPSVEECQPDQHQWMEDCTSRTCSVCGKYERVAP